MGWAKDRLTDLLYEALETEIGGVAVYETALECARDSGRRRQWRECLEQTRRHVDVVRDLITSFGLDPDATTPGRAALNDLKISLVKAMRTARLSGNGRTAEVVADECVELTVTRDQLNWKLLRACAESLTNPRPASSVPARSLRPAF